ncbi:MAG: peptidylprolyl isomerase, partial [Deltaproteobacteria bacterium]
MRAGVREGLLLAATACGALLGCRRPGAPAAVVATVNGEPVSVDDFKRSLAQARLDSAGLGPRSGNELELARQEELDRLIERTELLQAARQAGVSASEAEVDQAFLAMKADYAGTSFDELLADEEISPGDLRQRLRDQIVIHKLFREQVFSRVVVTPQEVEAYEAAHPADLDRPEQVHAEQIVVKTEEGAQALRAAIKGGSSFED